MKGRWALRPTVAAVAAALTLVTRLGAAAPGEAPVLARIVVDGTINPAVAEYVHEAIGRAAAQGAAALVIQLDTPGGLLQSARAVVKDILAAPLPVVVYVAPSGAGAASAGVFITMAAHVAAMAPGTSIGAAHPVGGQGQDIPGAMGEKVESFTASFSEAIARQRGRNVEWAVKAVRKSESLAADEAAKKNVVDLVARDLDELVTRTKGRSVEVGGVARTLDLTPTLGPDGHVRVVDYEMRLAQRLLDVLADPNIAYILMMAGLLGLYVEFTNPGVVLPGVAGAISLVLGLTAMHVLSVNYGGLALIGLGAALLVAEAFMPTFGVLGVGGLVAFVLGSLFLFDAEGSGVAVARSLIAGAAAAFALVGLLVGTLVVRSQRRQASGGREGMRGAVGVARERLDPQGMVLVRGEYWTATSDTPIERDEPVEVVAVDGLRLRVRRANPPRRRQEQEQEVSHAG
jgi:membrane-bound serine protease (ClpP class)